MRKEQSTNSINEQYLFTACELNSAMALIGGRWKIPILLSISKGNNRFSLLLKDLEYISEQVLGRQIKELEKNSLITKKKIPNTIPLGVEYSLTNRTIELLPILNNLCVWGKQYTP